MVLAWFPFAPFFASCITGCWIYRRYYLYGSSHDSRLHNVTAATTLSQFGLQHVTCEYLT